MKIFVRLIKTTCEGMSVHTSVTETETALSNQLVKGVSYAPFK